MKVSESEFRELLQKSKVPVVADFYADWCGPCRSFAPLFQKVGDRLCGDYSFCKVNIDEAGALCEELGIRVVPTIIVFDKSRAIAEHSGTFASDAEFEKFIRSSVK